MIAKYTFLATALLLGASSATGAQQPTSADISQALASRPGAAALVQRRIAASGMTAEQVRSRLISAGYPAGLLDLYMPGATPASSLLEPDGDALGALRELGFVSTLEDDFPTHRLADTTTRHDSTGSSARVFGLDVFRRSTSQFEPTLAGPVDASYKLGAGDVLVLILTGSVELAHTLHVTREGFVVIPQVGQLYLANLSLEQSRELVYQRLRAVYSGIGRGVNSRTQFHLTVARLRTNQVFVIGEVQSPGNYPVSSAGTMLTALYAARGPSDNGTLRRIELRRGGRTISMFDVYDYLIRGDASNDARLETGDVIFVGPHGPRVSVAGEVLRPALYELRPGEVLADLIRAAGGFTPQAFQGRVLVSRILPAHERRPGGMDRVVLDASSEQLNGGTAAGFALEAGDDVQVFAITDRVRNRIEVQGNVWLPGAQGYVPRMLLSDALRQAGGVRPDIYLGQVLVTRTRSDRSLLQLRTSFTDTLGTLSSDLALQEDDVVQVFAIGDFRPERYVSISGAVRNAGQVPYREGMTLRELVILAGGLHESAYLEHAEIARLPASRAGGVVATKSRVPLDSTYLLERSPDGRYLGPPGLPVSTRIAPEVPLLPYDQVLILQQPDWELQQTVYIGGEVVFPGQYTLLTKEDRLSDLVQRAGGLTGRAYLEGVSFIRPHNATGRIGIDLARALKDPRTRDNLVLRGGDSLTIPDYQPVVKVEGAVNSPIAVSYVRGAKLDYYILAAGGASHDADKARSYVRQPNGSVETYKRRPLMIPNSVPEPRPGSVIVVPAKGPSDKDYTAMAGAVAQIVVGVVGIIALIVR